MEYLNGFIIRLAPNKIIIINIQAFFGSLSFKNIAENIITKTPDKCANIEASPNFIVEIAKKYVTM